MNPQTDPVPNQNTKDLSPAAKSTSDPGSLNFVPLGPEIAPAGEITTLAPEASSPDNKLEKEAEKETAPKVTAETASQPQQTAESTIQKTISKPTIKVVDKTKEKTKTHRIENPGDKLTSAANKEEEEFIEEVETAHGHK